MNPIVFNIIAVICGFVVGSAVNLLIIYYGPFVVPPPEGVDTTTVEGLKEGLHLMDPIHYIVPFAAHFAGTFAGAFVAGRIAVTHKTKFALSIGFLFLIGGIVAGFMIPAPGWFIAVDLILAYIPAAYLAAKLQQGKY
jgi:hypothetical protein